MTVGSENLGNLCNAANMCLYVMGTMDVNDLVEGLKTATGFDYTPEELLTCAGRMILLKRGQINLILEIHKEKLYYHFDPLNPEAQLLYLQLSQLQTTAALQSPISGTSVKPLTVTGTRYIDFLIPGLIAMGVMMSCSWGLSYGIIERRSKKLLRRMIATPMRKSNFLIALFTVRLGMNFVEKIQYFIARFGIQISRGLVGQKQGRLIDQRSGDRHTLPLSSREFGGPVVFPVVHFHHFQGFVCFFGALLFIGSLVDEGKLDVVKGRGPGKQIEDLKNESDLLIADERQFVSVGTAPVGGAFRPVGEAIASVLNEHWSEAAWRVQPEGTMGSLQNIRELASG